MNDKANRGIFDPQNADPASRIVSEIDDLVKKVDALRTFGHKIVLTMGTFDLAHIGHFRYLEAASKHGFLVVGVDSDAKTRKRKGPHRPVVNEQERMEILCHIRHVHMVILKSDKWPKLHLIKKIKPDVLIATQDNYTEEEVTELQEKYCGEVLVLEPQATTTTTAKVRTIMVGGLDSFKKEVAEQMPRVLEEAFEKVINKES